MSIIKPWSMIDETIVRVGYRQITRRNYQLPNGKTSIYDIINDNDTTTTLALTTDNQVILVEQFRPGPSEVLLELPGGLIEAGQSPLETAEHELLEETGYRGELIYVASAYHHGYSTRKCHITVAVNCRRMTDPAPEPEEFLNVILMSLDDFREHVRRGRLTDAGTAYRGLDYLGLL